MHFALKIRSLQFPSFAQTEREITHYVTKSKKSYFWFAPPPCPGTGLLQTIPHPWAQSAGLVLGVAQTGDCNRSNWTMHYNKNKMKLSLFKCLWKERATTVYESEIGNVKQKPREASALAGYLYKGYHSIQQRPTSVPILRWSLLAAVTWGSGLL